MYKSEVILYWIDEDEAFVAEAPELPGCMAHGADQETTLGNIKDAMHFWIDRAGAGAARPGAQGRAPHARLARPMQRHLTAPASRGTIEQSRPV